MRNEIFVHTMSILFQDCVFTVYYFFPLTIVPLVAPTLSMIRRALLSGLCVTLAVISTISISFFSCSSPMEREQEIQSELQNGKKSMVLVGLTTIHRGSSFIWNSSEVSENIPYDFPSRFSEISNYSEGSESFIRIPNECAHKYNDQDNQYPIKRIVFFAKMSDNEDMDKLPELYIGSTRSRSIGPTHGSSQITVFLPPEPGEYSILGYAEACRSSGYPWYSEKYITMFHFFPKSLIDEMKFSVAEFGIVNLGWVFVDVPGFNVYSEGKYDPHNLQPDKYQRRLETAFENFISNGSTYQIQQGLHMESFLGFSLFPTGAFVSYTDPNRVRNYSSTSAKKYLESRAFSFIDSLELSSFLRQHK